MRVRGNFLMYYYIMQRMQNRLLGTSRPSGDILC
nr:MAG TPA: hypothetical protein [Caudoviricetes sp.]DAP71948.1 MAG TPA: hypothetical protein [Caudoviricetes sp.]DAT41067.1 MAG TPA: hypothetical protein [Caudoviricetes sp.]DAT78266.1 MAG TPA: hypothetical protein [Caudoviricetes sp.]